MKLIVREHKGIDGTSSCAVYSECEKYRYYLRRRWKQGKKLVFIMLNPSIATEMENDPTVQRCETRARNGEYGGLAVVNIFAYRATDPKDMKKQENPVGGTACDIFIKAAIRDSMSGHCDLICGWGTHGVLNGRNNQVYEMFSGLGVRPMALSWTKDLHPQHPLYLPYNAVPMERPL